MPGCISLISFMNSSIPGEEWESPAQKGEFAARPTHIESQPSPCHRTRGRGEGIKDAVARNVTVQLRSSRSNILVAAITRAGELETYEDASFPNQDTAVLFPIKL